MSSREVARNQLTFEERAKYFKKNVEEFFTTYKNEGGGEDCIEVCLIREGRRAVVMAEEEINRLQAENKRLSTLAELGDKRANDYRVMRDRALKAEAENERLKAKCENTQIGYNFAEDEIKNLKKDKYKLQKALNQSEDYRVIAKAEAYKEFAERLKKALYSDSCRLVFDSDLDIFECAIDNLLKELVGDSNEVHNSAPTEN